MAVACVDLQGNVEFISYREGAIMGITSQKMLESKNWKNNWAPEDFKEYKNCLHEVHKRRTPSRFIVEHTKSVGIGPREYRIMPCCRKARVLVYVRDVALKDLRKAV